MKVLGRIRLSRSTEESTSVERQREAIQRWASDHDHEIVGWAEDLDVSGAVNPFQTPALGVWLTDEKKHEWDIICAWKLDRISRRAVPMGSLFSWLLDNDKTLVCTADSIDLSTPMGRLIAYVIATIAEGELEAIRERNRVSHQKLRELGRWTGGKPIYGYTPKKLPEGGWELTPDPESSKVLLEVVDRVLDGESLGSIAADLTDRGTPTSNDYIRLRTGKESRGHRWTSGNLSRLLRSTSLLGYANHRGVTVRDTLGDPIPVGEPLISVERFHRLQSVLESRSVVSSTRTRNTSPLLGVARCTCGEPLYLRKVYGKYRYYRCAKRCSPAVDAGMLEELLEEKFLADFGETEVTERVYVQAEDHQIELDQARSAVDEITTLLGTITSETVRSQLLGQISALDAKITKLEQLPTHEAGWESRNTGETYREVWERSGTEERRQLLLKSGITARVAKPENTDALVFDLVRCS